MKDCVMRYFEKYQEDLQDGISLEEMLSDLNCTKEELVNALDELWKDCGIAYKIGYNALFNMDIISIWKLL